MKTRSALRTIVAATDFSANAEVALAWAAQLARQHRATLVLVHAFHSELIALSELGPLLRAHRGPMRARAMAALEREAERARSTGVRTDCELRTGAAFRTVIAVAERRKADLIVAGTRGHTTWRSLLLGSTAARLVRHARCAVMTVHPSDGPPRPVRTVLVATDFSEEAALAAAAATRVLGGSEVDRRLVLLHAYDVPFEATSLPDPVLMDAIAAVDTTIKRTIEALAAKLRATGSRVDTLACAGYPPRMILDQATAAGADLIAMGTHGRSAVDHLLLGSTAERVLGAASCPVLTVRCERCD